MTYFHALPSLLFFCRSNNNRVENNFELESLHSSTYDGWTANSCRLDIRSTKNEKEKRNGWINFILCAVCVLFVWSVQSIDSGSVQTSVARYRSQQCTQRINQPAEQISIDIFTYYGQTHSRNKCKRRKLACSFLHAFIFICVAGRTREKERKWQENIYMKWWFKCGKFIANIIDYETSMETATATTKRLTKWNFFFVLKIEENYERLVSSWMNSSEHV